MDDDEIDAWWLARERGLEEPAAWRAHLEKRGSRVVVCDRCGTENSERARHCQQCRACITC